MNSRAFRDCGAWPWRACRLVARGVDLRRRPVARLELTSSSFGLIGLNRGLLRRELVPRLMTSTRQNGSTTRGGHALVTWKVASPAASLRTVIRMRAWRLLLRGRASRSASPDNYAPPSHQVSARAPRAPRGYSAAPQLWFAAGGFRSASLCLAVVLAPPRRRPCLLLPRGALMPPQLKPKSLG